MQYGIEKVDMRRKRKTKLKRFSHGKPETRCFCAAVSVHRGKQRCGDIYRFAHFFHHHIVPTFIPLATTRPPRELGLTLSFNVMATEFQKKCPQMQLFFGTKAPTFPWLLFQTLFIGSFSSAPPPEPFIAGPSSK